MNNELSSKIKTYLAQIENGNIESKQVEVLAHIKENPGIDTDQLRDQLRMAHQSLTACISNLLDIGIIEIIGEVELDEDSFYSKYNYVDDEPTIIKNQKERHLAKFKQWVKRGLKDFIEFIDEPTFKNLETAIYKLPQIIGEHKEIEATINRFDKNGQGNLF
jgi:hypothetical protein